MKNTSFKISTDTTKMNLDFIHDYLCNTSYWAKNRSMELVKKSMDNSLCFSIFAQDGSQVAFARVATDYVVFAWLMDVFVREDLQGKGIGHFLLDAIVNHPELKTVNGIGLRTKDACSFYQKYGFKAIVEPDTWMLKRNNTNQ